jgi:hypothetical protein
MGGGGYKKQQKEFVMLFVGAKFMNNILGLL